MIRLLLCTLISLFIAAISYAQNGIVHQREFLHDGNMRSYNLYVPDTYTAQEDWPLIINYHGHGSNNTNQMNIHSVMNVVADSAHFLVAYPAGLPVELRDFGTAIGWKVPGTMGEQDDVAFTDRLIDQIAQDFRVDLERIYATGFSNGSSMAFHLAFMMSDRITAVAGVAGPMTFDMVESSTPERPFSTMLIHGTADSMALYEGIPGEILPAQTTASFWASTNHCSPDSIVTEMPDLDDNDNCTVTLIEYTNCDPPTSVRFYRVHNGGHTWPGDGTPVGFLGNVNRDINANSEMWNFFKSMRLSQFDLPQHDLKVRSLAVHLAQLPMHATGIQPSVSVRNAGLNDESGVSITCDIDSAGILIYSDTQMIDELKRFESTEVSFDNFHTYDQNSYDIKFYTQLASDESRASDTLKTQIAVSNVVDDFEVGVGKWETTGGWRVSESANQGRFGLQSNPAPRYSNNSDTHAMFRFGFDLSNAYDAQLSFWSYQLLASGDSGFVEISTDSGSNWERLGDAIVGVQNSWQEHTRSLENYKGSEEVRFRFRLISDASGNAAGWFIDDVTINLGITDVEGTEEGAALSGFELLNNYPNPFNPSTTIRYHLPIRSPVNLEILDMLGRKVRTLIQKKEQVAGTHTFVWDARDDRGYPVSSGVYLFRLRAGKFSQVRKMMLVR